MSQKLPYRLGVGVMLLNNQNQVFVGKRIDTTSDAWQMPQGGIDEGEDPEQAAIRELAEETGVTNADMLAMSNDWYYYDLPDEIIPKIWGGKFCGQKQKWFCMKFLGNSDEINIKTAEPEFNDWKWIEPELLPTVIVPFKQKLYSQIVEEFSSYCR